MIDINNEQIIDLNEACRERVFKNHKSGKAAHISKLHRLAQFGARDINGDRVRLEVIKTPTGLRTSREAIERFIARLTNPEATDAVFAVRRTRGASVAVTAANAELDAAGV